MQNRKPIAQPTLLLRKTVWQDVCIQDDYAIIMMIMFTLLIYCKSEELVKERENHQNTEHMFRRNTMIEDFPALHANPNFQ